MGKNKWVCAAIPALLLHCSIGTVYCWGTFSKEIAAYIGADNKDVQWAFSLAIFFLGMSAAFLGDVVEKDIKKSSLIATISSEVTSSYLPVLWMHNGCRPRNRLSFTR